MKKGAEPLRSFSDLAQFLGHIKPVDPEEEKRRKKQERIAKKREADEANARSSEQEQEQGQEQVQEQAETVQSPLVVVLPHNEEQ